MSCYSIVFCLVSCSILCYALPCVIFRAVLPCAFHDEVACFIVCCVVFSGVAYLVASCVELLMLVGFICLAREIWVRIPASMKYRKHSRPKAGVKPAEGRCNNDTF